MSETFTNLPLIFGLFAASLHVLSGPDHLAAIAPLALNTRFQTWLVGMAWGIGHLIGMLIIGTLFFYFKELIPVDFISEYSEKTVGILLIVIGFWALFRLLKLNAFSEHSHFHTHDDERGNVFLHKHNHPHKITRMHTHPHTTIIKQTCWAALGIGIVHGLAGVSHILGLLPTLAFKSSFDSILYLVGFGAGTILAMVAFSVILGIIGNSDKIKNRKKILQAINATAGIAAIFVGVFWIWSTW
jgi:ABC-type nickel/cobalt efflux system permease component RcnA